MPKASTLEAVIEPANSAVSSNPAASSDEPKSRAKKGNAGPKEVAQSPTHTCDSSGPAWPARKVSGRVLIWQPPADSPFGGPAGHSIEALRTGVAASR